MVSEVLSIMAIYLIGKLFASVKYQNQFKNDEANVMGTSLFKIFKYLFQYTSIF